MAMWQANDDKIKKIFFLKHLACDWMSSPEMSRARVTDVYKKQCDVREMIIYVYDDASFSYGFSLIIMHSRHETLWSKCRLIYFLSHSSLVWKGVYLQNVHCFVLSYKKHSFLLTLRVLLPKTSKQTETNKQQQKRKKERKKETMYDVLLIWVSVFWLS